jgi:hypothetical protein
MVNELAIGYGTINLYSTSKIFFQKICFLKNLLYICKKKHIMNQSTIVLERSTNTHKMTNVLSVKEINPSTLSIETQTGSRVIHGEHGTIGVESPYVVKYTQQELNPVTKALQNAWD